MEFVKDIRPASDRSLHVSFGDEISMESYGAGMRLTRELVGERGILNLHPAYASVLVDFDPRLRTHQQIEALVRERLGMPDTVPAEEARTIEIPVRYGGEFGPDLEDVARHTGFAAERVVELFAAAEYRVYFVGFSTCFPYLGGLPPELATPRLSAPRKHRSEEHTSELQSLRHLVCRLLLEKNKKQTETSHCEERRSHKTVTGSTRARY